MFMLTKEIKSRSQWFQTNDLDMLAKARCFLGFSRSICINLGTGSNHANPSVIDESGTEHEGRWLNLESFAATVGTAREGAVAQFQGQMAVFNSMQADFRWGSLTFRDKIRCAERSSMLVYDWETKIGWLVPGKRAESN